MTQRTDYSPPHADAERSSVPEAAKSQAAEVGKSAVDRAADVAGTIGDQARQVVSETGTQTRHLLEEGVDQLRGQARDGQQKLAGGLRDLAGELRQMSDRTEGSGMATNLVGEVTQRADQVASWLESREPGDLVSELRLFARRRPGLFLAGAAVAGVVAGRLTRNIVASAQNDDQPSPDRTQRPEVHPGGLPSSSLPVTPPAYPSTPAGAYQPPPAPLGSTREPEAWPVTPAGQPGPGPVRS